MAEERLQKILARAGLGSRREAETLIAQGRVKVNGVTATLGMKADPERDQITVDGIRYPSRSLSLPISFSTNLRMCFQTMRFTRNAAPFMI